MADINKTILLGRLGADPITRQTKGGVTVTTFSLATEQYNRTKNESETTWHRIVTWGKPAERCGEELKKGMSLFLEGRMKVRKFESNGQQNYMHEVHADNVKFLHRRTPLNTLETVTADQDEPSEELLN